MTTARRKSSPVAPGVEAARPDAGDNHPGASHHPPPTAVAPHRASTPHNNLSLPRSPLIGRDHALATAQQLLLQEHIGLLTLTGPGGIGKTRLAMQVAANLLDHFVDGIYFVALAPISDPDLVGAAIAQTLGVREAVGQSLAETLQTYLKDRQLLLVLDNFEQVVAAAMLVGDLLNACRRLKTLVTSRITLHLYGEQEFPVSPLSLPDANHLPTARLSEFAAIDLFCQRARAAKPDFALTSDNADDVAKICLRLDGLPLAIELAAARIKLFAPSALLFHLNQRLPLLTGGLHDQPARQRTLRDDIAWSYDLLSTSEQALFRRLVVFVGGFTLEAAQAVGKADGDLPYNVLEGVATLVDQNLLKQMAQPRDEARFGLLETIREFGLERLEASGEAEAIHRQHASFFLALAEAVGPGLFGAGQGAGLARLRLEHANLQSALRWSQQEDARTAIALRLSTALQGFWLIMGLWSEGRHWLDSAMTRTDMKHTIIRAEALVGAGELAAVQGDHRTAHVQLKEGLAIAKELGAQILVSQALMNLGLLAYAQHDHALTITRLEEALVIARVIDNKNLIASTLQFLGNVARDQQHYTPAQALYEEALALYQTVGSPWNFADTLVCLGQLAQQQGDYAHAWTLFQKSLAGWRALDTLQWKGTADCLEGIANICAIQRQFTETARLFGAAEVLREFLGPAPPPLPGISAANKLAGLRAHLDETAFVAAWAEGRTFTAEQAIDYALSLPAPPALVSPSAGYEATAPILSPAYPAGLTAREVEVLQLLAQGLTYAQIADKLIITRRTVNGHVTSIYSKLGVNGRAAATRFAVEQQLV